MADRLRHRGPDGHGSYLEEVGPRWIALAHQRLSILDLSEAASQPMTSASGRWVIVFNGEIYNHLTLRAEVQQTFRTRSDTETLLACLEKWGLPGALQKIAGMFALAAWDKKERKLFLARDRMGEKPLYYGGSQGNFYFASELKALTSLPSFQKDVDPEALELFLRFSFIPAPHSIYLSAKKLPPGHWLVVDAHGQYGAPECYWAIEQVAQRGLDTLLAPSIAEEAIEACLKLVLREQREADVNVGVSLSGGIDSSLLTALLAEDQPPRTFSIGFHDAAYDESAQAQKIATHLHTKHTQLFVEGQDALNLIPELPSIYDEPFADASQIPTILLSRLIRTHVTVHLSGDGGDEVFAGYNRYVFALRLWRTLGPLAPLAKLSRLLPNFDRWFGLRHAQEKMEKIIGLGEAKKESDIYWMLARQGLGPARAYAAVEKRVALTGLAGMQVRDQLLYLPDDILVKVDRASMAASLESRAPYLDHRLVELAWRLPLSLRTRGTQGKIVLRKMLAKRLPAKLWDRAKTGFSPPLNAWLNGPLRPWAEDLLSEKSLKETNLPQAALVRTAWEQHCKGTTASGFRLWAPLMAQAWLRSSR